MSILQSPPLSITDITKADAEILGIYLSEAQLACGCKGSLFKININLLVELYLESSLIETAIILAELMCNSRST